MENPNIKYMISIQRFPKTGKFELLLAKPNKDETDYDAIVVIPAKNDNELNGSNIVFSEDGITVSGEKMYKIDDLAVGIQDNQPYLYLEKSYEKIWNLPWEVVDFLEMNIVKESYGMSIIDDKPHVVKTYIRNTCNAKKRLSSKKELILRKHEDSLGFTSGDEEIDKKNKTTKFILFESEDKNEKIQNSYFELYESKYYFHECQVRENKGIIGVYSNCRTNGEELTNVTCCLGYVDFNN